MEQSAAKDMLKTQGLLTASLFGVVSLPMSPIQMIVLVDPMSTSRRRKGYRLHSQEKARYLKLSDLPLSIRK